jgi:exonuclease VII small subunit
MNTNRDDQVPATVRARIDAFEETHEDIPGLMDRLEVGQLTLEEARLYSRELQRRHTRPGSDGNA